MFNDKPRHAPFEPSSETDISYSSPARENAAPEGSTRVLPVSAGMGRVGRRRSARHASMPVDPDPWSRTLAALQQFNAAPSEFPDEFMYSRLQSRPGPSRQKAPTFTVNVLEYLANRLVVVSWHDPTLCNYEEQVWSPALARHSGQCALSGSRISRGDTVYKPRTRGRIAPLNGDAMILASALKGVPENQV
ncbi:MAG: hypothetical protein QOC89_7 [Paraburkholderia sp.]|jgi:Domain of unknown function (DUF3331)|nr:hypothetical protein [Paraburkholderia sp.]